jgi:hypothetical protein
MRPICRFTGLGSSLLLRETQQCPERRPLAALGRIGGARRRGLWAENAGS